MVSTAKRESMIERELNPPRSRFLPLWLPFCCAFTIRLIVVACNFRQTPDAAYLYERFGWEMGWTARALAMGHGFSAPFAPLSGPTALVPPLYPSLLAEIFRMFGVYSVTSAFTILTLNSLFSSLICVTLYFIARNTFSERTGRIAAWAWALHPFAIYFSGDRVWDYALCGLLFSVCILIAQRLPEQRNLLTWLGFGLLYGLTALSNPAVLCTFPFLLAWALYRARESFWVRSLLGRGALAVFGVIVMVGPWTVRNLETMHVLCPIRDNFWLEFYAGNAGDTSDPNPAWAHPATNPKEMSLYLAGGETKYLAQKHLLAVAQVRQHPVLFVEVTVRRIVYYWTGFWSFSPRFLKGEPFEIPTVVFCGSLTVLMLMGMAQLFRRNRTAAFPYMVFLLIFPLTYYITHPLMDYRQPIEPEITILVVLALTPSRAEKTEEEERAEEYRFAQV